MPGRLLAKRRRGPIAVAGVFLASSALAIAQTTAPANPPNSPTASQPAYKPDATAAYQTENGQFSVAVVDDYELYDRKRDIKLPLLLRFPKGAAMSASQPIQPSSQPQSAPTSRPAASALPLVIFSHGAGGSGDAFAELSRMLASHGYVVIHPTHSDSIRRRRQQGEDPRDLRNDPTQLRRNVNPVDRMADVRLILDRLDKIEQDVAGLHGEDRIGRIDRERIAIAGHSAGAFTSQMAIGVKMRGVRVTGGRGGIRSVGDPRIRAAVIISGQGLTNASMTEESWKDVTRPMLVFAGSLDTSAISDETPESRRHPFELARAGDKYLVWIEGATHSSYSGRGVTRLLGEQPTTDLKIITDVVGSATLAFLDAHIREDENAKRYLAGESISKLSGGAATLSRK